MKYNFNSLLGITQLRNLWKLL